MKPKRGRIWTIGDKEMLQNLIRESAHIIESKTSINEDKDKEWIVVTNRLNSITGKRRLVEDVQLTWKKMKLEEKNIQISPGKQIMKTEDVKESPSPPYHDYDLKGPTTCDSDDSLSEDVDEDRELSFYSRHSQEIKINTENTESKGGAQGNSSTHRTLEGNSHLEITTTEVANSSIDAEFKKKHLEMLQEEHEYNIKIAKLKVKKLEIEIALLQNKIISDD